MIGIGAQEPVELLHGACGVVVLEVDVRKVNLRLLGVGAERIACFELGIVVARHFPGALVHGRARLRIKLIGRPVPGRIDLNGLQPGAAAQSSGGTQQGNFG